MRLAVINLKLLFIFVLNLLIYICFNFCLKLYQEFIILKEVCIFLIKHIYYRDDECLYNYLSFYTRFDIIRKQSGSFKNNIEKFNICLSRLFSYV